jgi:hypothetical protein
MKKRLLYLSAVLTLGMSFNAQAQAIENGDFEDIQTITRQYPSGDPFTYDSIGGYWVTGDEIKKDLTILGSAPFAKDTSWTFSGNHAIVMRTQDIGGIIGTGNCGVGVYEFDDTNPFNSVKIGVPFTGRPEKLRGHYAYESVANDSCWVLVFFSKWNGASRDTIGMGQFVSSQSTGMSAYSLMEIPVSWTSASTPDTMGLLMVSSKGGYELFPPAGQVGSTLVMDSVSFVYDNNSLGENGKDYLSFQTQLDHINIQSASPEVLYAKVYDVSGKLIEAREIKQGENRFYLPQQRQMYLFQIEGGSTSISRKIIF